MILKSEDLKGSILDKPEYEINYSANNHAFCSEFEKLKKLTPGHPGWDSALYFFKIYKDKHGYRIAMPIKFIPKKIDGRMYFQDYLLSETVFPNQYQALDIAAKIVRAHMGY